MYPLAVDRNSAAAWRARIGLVDSRRNAFSPKTRESSHSTARRRIPPSILSSANVLVASQRKHTDSNALFMERQSRAL